MQVSEADIEKLCFDMKQVALRNCRSDEERALVKDVTPKQLLSWGILTEYEGKLVPTNAYAILTGADILHCTFQCAVFKDNERVIFVDRREFMGAVQDIIEDAYQFVLRNIHLGAVIEGLYRQDVYEIPPAAIRELIINAAVHRSYLDNGNIQVAIFDNRLEITSPGKLPLGQTIEKMREGYSKVRNEALAMAFSYMHLIERWGTGMLRIAKMIREAGLGELEILGGETELRFNIYRKQATEQASEEKAGQASETDTKAGQGAGQASEIDIKAGQGAGQALESEEIILVDFLAKNPRSNIREIAQNLVLSKSAVDRLIKKLKTKNYRTRWNQPKRLLEGFKLTQGDAHMDKTAIKNYAIWARTKLIEDIKYKASLLGITEKGIADALPQSTTQEQYFDIGTREPYAIRGVHIAQRRSLAEAIMKKAQESDYLTAYNSIIEEVAYTWFNRFIAVRFMEVNDYLPCKIRVLSAVDGRQEPDIVQNPFDAKLDYTSAEEELISQHQMNNEGDKLFNMLFVKVCNDLSKVLPQLFEAEQDYTELLLNISYTDQDGLIYKLVHDIPEDNFDVNAVDEEGKPIGQVEIIGWLYQYYNTEPKNETFALLKKNVKITKERISSATQLFTPDWIVRYMVENSLGRLVISGQLVVDSGQNLVDSEEERIAKEKELAERFGWKYYLPEAKQDADVREQLNQLTTNNYSPETIKVIDPCMGSGHILVYAFDVLMQIYTQMGYTDKDAVLSILENNLYGLDIDKRAFQLAYFAVLMKARQYHKFILKKQPQCHIYAIAESNGINMKHLAYFGAQLDELAKPVALNQMHELLATLHDAKEYGSIISVADYDWELLHQFAAEFDISGEMGLFDNSFGIEATQQRLQELVTVGEVLAQKYEVVVTNPPYRGVADVDVKLADYIKTNYPDSKNDLFAVFMEVCHKMNVKNGYQAMITQHAWMFLSSFEKLRAKIQKLDIVDMAHLGARAFEEIAGEVVQTTSFILANKHVDGYKGTYCRLVEPTTQQGKEEMFLSQENRYIACSDNFAKIPGAPVAYWVSENVVSVFEHSKNASEFAEYKHGMSTGKNDAVVRFWSEVDFNKIAFSCKNHDDLYLSKKRFVPYNKGGEGRNGMVINLLF